MNRLQLSRRSAEFPTSSGAGRADLLPYEAGDAKPLVVQYAQIVMRRKWVIVGALLAVIALGLLITLLMTPKYTATTSIEIARESNKIVNLQGVEQEATDTDQEFYQTQFGLLRSRTLAERVARKLRLVDNPAFFEMFGKDPSEEPGQTIANGSYAPAGRAFRTRLAGEILLDNVAINPTRLSRLVNVAATTADAELSARIANAWAQNFIELTLERRYEASSYARNFLESRLDQLRRRLEASERQLVTYAANEKIITLPGGTSETGDVGERSIVADDLARFNSELAKATAERVAAAARFDQQRARAGESTQALDNNAINTLRARRAELASEYEKLITQFEPAYPPAQALKSQLQDIDRSIAREEGRVSGALGNEYRGAVEREQQLASRVADLKEGLLDLRRRSIQYNIYQREVDSTRILYNGLLQRYKEIGITGGVGVNNISVVDRAQAPDKPSSPRPLLNFILSIMLGVMIGGALALLLEHLDESIGDPADVAQKVGLPLLGSVPIAHDREIVDELKDRKSDLFDAYLAVQTALALATERGLPRSLSITSTRPAEGKSTTALALATTLSRSGRRTLLIDGDMRSPSLHALLGTGNDSGLSTYLAGQDDLTPLLIDTEAWGFTAMLAGPLPPNAAELLTSERFKTLLTRLLERFDHVIVDSPPVMGLADAPLIGGAVGSVVFVVAANGVRARFVRNATDRLRLGGGEIVGAVLTKFDAGRVTYGDAYHYGYGREQTAKG